MRLTITTMTEIFRPKVNFNSLQMQPINQFAFQQVLKLTGVKYQYLIDKDWRDSVSVDRPLGKRALFSDVDSFRGAREAYFVWFNLASLIGKEKPVFPEKIIERFYLSAYSDKPLTIFIPWGFRPNGSFGYKELLAMDNIDEALFIISQRKITPKVILMPADIYATEVNGLPKETVNKYFLSVEQEGKNRGYQILPWSQIRNDNLQRYKSLNKQYTVEEISQILPKFVIESAIKAAEKRGQKKDSAFAYLRERLCEAEIIENTLKPIKISMVAKNKDESVDLNLPRFYLLPENLQFPWL